MRSNPREYFRMFDAASWRDPGGRLHTLQLVLCKCVDTYVAVKRNQNQICWKWTKVGGRVDRGAGARSC
jgi:phosphoethanolamine N-methyltransferase